MGKSFPVDRENVDSEYCCILSINIIRIIIIIIIRYGKVKGEETEVENNTGG